MKKTTDKRIKSLEKRVRQLEKHVSKNHPVFAEEEEGVTRVEVPGLSLEIGDIQARDEEPSQAK